MDTEKFIICSGKMEGFPDDILYIEGNLEELSFVTDYVEITRCLEEIYQWYQIIKFNVDLLKSVSVSNNVIAVNSYMISLLSAGKSFVDLMKQCMKSSYGDDSYIVKFFIENCVAKEYDDCFSYRFLIRMRNFSQHYHIPISYQNNSFCFDVLQIYNTPHYHFNKKLKDEVEKIIEDVRVNENRSLTLAIEPTVSSYICSLYKIFKSFLQQIRKDLVNKQSRCFKEIEQHPELIEHLEYPEYNGCFFYYIHDFPDTLHAIDTTENPQGLLSSWLNDVVNSYKEETKYLKRIMKFMELNGMTNKD